MKLLRLFFVCALLALLPTTRGDAAVTATPVFVQTPNIGNQTFISGTDSAGTFKTIYTGATNGSKCVGLYAISNDNTATHLLTVEIIHGATTTPIEAVTIPLSGVANTYGVTLNLWSPANFPGMPVDSDGNPYIYLTNGDTLKMTFATAITATDQINVVATCADF